MRGTHEYFNDRYTVIQNMNKLSTILLSRSTEHKDKSSINRPEIEGGNSFKDRDSERKTFSAVTRTSGNKFIRLTMAMLTSKGIINLIY